MFRGAKHGFYHEENVEESEKPIQANKNILIPFFFSSTVAESICNG